MARRQVSMTRCRNHLSMASRKSVKGIERSFGVDRKTVRKYVALLNPLGFYRDRPFPLRRNGEPVGVFE